MYLIITKLKCFCSVSYLKKKMMNAICRCQNYAVFRCRTWTQWSPSAATSPRTCSPTRTISTSWVTHSFQPSQIINLSLSQIAGKSVLLFTSISTNDTYSNQNQKAIFLICICWLIIAFDFSQRCKLSWFHSTKLRSSAAKSWWFYGYIGTTSRYVWLRPFTSYLFVTSDKHFIILSIDRSAILLSFAARTRRADNFFRRYLVQEWNVSRYVQSSELYCWQSKFYNSHNAYQSDDHSWYLR